MIAGIDEARDLDVYFPKGFQPRTNDVIIGRGEKCYYHAGNQKLRRIVASRLEEYSTALSQKDKTEIISSILEELRSSSTNVAFVKLHPKSKRWFDIGDALVRDKISQAFRDALQGNYKYSYGKRRQKAQECWLKRAQFKAAHSRVNLDFTDTEHNPNSVQLNLLDSSVGLTGSSNVASSLTSIISSRLTKYENPFEPTPIFEVPLMSTPIELQELGERDFLLLEKELPATGEDQTYDFSPTAETMVAKMA